MEEMEETLIDAINKDIAKIMPKQAAMVVKFDEITLHIKKIDEKKYRMRYAEYLCDTPANRELMKNSGEMMKATVSIFPELGIKMWKEEEKKGMLGVRKKQK